MEEKRLLLLSKIEIIYELLNKNFAQALKNEKIELTTEQFRLLDILADNEGIKQSNLSELIGRQRATISRGIDILEAKEFIIRKDVEGDKRAKAVFLTKKSKKSLKKAQELYINIAESTLKELSNKEVDKFDKTLDSIIEKM
jgi:DNA-binding MarR family transcriptional regulator